jgi:hypothetical protein
MMASNTTGVQNVVRAKAYGSCAIQLQLMSTVIASNLNAHLLKALKARPIVPDMKHLIQWLITVT